MKQITARAIEIVKQNPWKITLGTIITVAVSVGSIYFTDKRYVKQEDFKVQYQQLQKQIDEIKELKK